MGDRNTGFHHFDADFTAGRKTAIAEAEMVARRQSNMARAKRLIGDDPTPTQRDTEGENEMTHDKIVHDLHRARKSGALDGPPRLSEHVVADFFRRLAKSTAINADNLLMFAEDILANEGGNDRALMLLDGARAGIQQAREAEASGRVVTIWFDGNASRATFSWDGDTTPDTDLHWAIANALNSALRANGQPKD